ncbi:MAG: VWA domain-containing protein, partial [Treponema sp.]|nr:VWA domain-containing protein [Treponema sp.]
MKKRFFSAVFAAIFIIVPFSALCAGGSQSGSSDTRGRYLAGRGIIMPPEEVFVDSFLASIDYNYPRPQSEMGVYLYNSSGQMSRGQEGILQIGIQGKSLSFAELPPMNLVFVVDCSDTMNEDEKINWVRESAAIFVNKIRPVDSLALVSFNETAQVEFGSTRMDSAEKLRRFLDAVNGLRPRGSSDLEKGLSAGYQQALTNFREGSVNRILFFSDGTEFSARLNRAGGQSGDVRVSLIWNNRNDIDLHVFTPRGEEIYYARKQDSTGGMLDVDMNVRGETTKPVENIFWGPGRAPQGRYRVVVQNYHFNESDKEPTPFRVEVKNGNNYSYFDGIVSGEGKSSNVEVASFDYKGASALKQEKALIYELAESYRQMGITTTTIGIGVGFDLELMRTLAEEGGGSSRFISDREEMKKLFDTEFERMVALVATDLDMSLEFAGGIEILETWGYQNRIEGNRISYKLPGLHLGDYETILVRYRMQSNTQGQANGGERELARFSVTAKDLLGRPLPLIERTVGVVLSESSSDGISSGMVLHSGTMLYFAEALKEIGDLYYAGQDDLSALSQLERDVGSREPSASQRERMDTLKENFLKRLESALKITRDSRLELENAKLRLDDQKAFTPELEILVNYDNILSKELVDSGGSPAGNYVGLGGFGPASAGMAGTGNAANMGELQNRLSALYKEIGLSFPSGQRSVAALAPFSIRGTDSETPLLAFINENALVSLSGNPGLVLVERDRLDAVRAEQNLLRQGLLDTDAA